MCYRNEAPSPFTEDGTIQKKLFQNILSLITGSVNTVMFSWQQVEKLAVNQLLWSSFLALHSCIRNLDFISYFVFLFPCFISSLSVFFLVVHKNNMLHSLLWRKKINLVAFWICKRWWDVVRILHIHMHYPIINKVGKLRSWTAQKERKQFKGISVEC